MYFVPVEMKGRIMKTNTRYLTSHHSQITTWNRQQNPKKVILKILLILKWSSRFLTPHFKADQNHISQKKVSLWNYRTEDMSMSIANIPISYAYSDAMIGSIIVGANR